MLTNAEIPSQTVVSRYAAILMPVQNIKWFHAYKCWHEISNTILKLCLEQWSLASQPSHPSSEQKSKMSTVFCATPFADEAHLTWLKAPNQPLNGPCGGITLVSYIPLRFWAQSSDTRLWLRLRWILPSTMLTISYHNNCESHSIISCGRFSVCLRAQWKAYIKMFHTFLEEFPTWQSVLWFKGRINFIVPLRSNNTSCLLLLHLDVWP